MIGDLVKNLSRYSKAFPFLCEVEDFILQNPLAKLSLGVTEIRGKDLFVNVMKYQTHEPNETLESHHEYADVHICDGSECVQYAPHPAYQPTVVYDQANDVEFFASEQVDTFILHKEYFLLFLPREAHGPGGQIGKPKTVRKYVFKIRV